MQVDCVHCFIRQTLQAGRFISNDEELHKQILKEVMKSLLTSSWDVSTATMANKLINIVKNLTHSSDPYYKVKKQYNQIAMAMYPYLNQLISETDDHLYTALKLAIAGNIIDFGAKERFDLRKTISTVLETPLRIDQYESFRKKIASTSSLVYLADNTGEIVFDKLLIETILEEHHIEDITFVVKEAPFLNDAMLEDAIEIGLDEISRLNFLEINSFSPEITNRGENQEFLTLLKTSDMVISKGQANYENFYNQEYIFFLLMVKCPLVANHLGVPEGSTVLRGPTVIK